VVNENEYKDVYSRVIGTKCVFEKAILLQFAQCEHAEKRLLAEREAINCAHESCQRRCQQFLDALRQKARFSLQQTQADQPLPHAKEAKVQAGGLFGLQQAIESADPAQVEALDDHRLRYNESDKLIANIYGLLDKAANQYKQLDRLPYSEMVKSILRFEVRKKRSRNRNKT
jgi:hypothetical protein